MGTFNATLFMVEILAAVAFFIVMQYKGSTPEHTQTSKKSAARKESSEFKKAA